MARILRHVTLLLIFVAALAPVNAQSTACDNAASEAFLLLEASKTAIEGANPDSALPLLDAAQAHLTACALDERAAAFLQQPLVAAGPSPTPEPLASGNAILTPPEVNIQQSIAFVRFANTSIDSGPVDIYFGRNTTPIVANLAYQEVTGFVPIPAGTFSFTGRPAGSGPDGEFLYRLEWNFLANSSWIVTAAGLRGQVAFIVEPISIVRNDYDGRARVRVVNFVQGEPRLAVSSDRGVDFGSNLGWVAIRDNLVGPGSYNLQVSTVTGTALTDLVPFDFQAGITYSLYITGGINGDPPITLLPIVANQDTTRVRFINERDGPVDVHYRPSDVLVAANLSPGLISDFVELPSGAAGFIAVVPGDGPRGFQLASLATQLRPGREVTITVTARSMEISEITLTAAG